MLTEKSARLYSLIAAVCFAILGVRSIIYDLRGVIKYDNGIQFSDVAYWIIVFGFAVSLVLAKKLPTLVFFAMEGLYATWNVIVHITHGSFSIDVLFWVAADIAGVLLLILVLNKNQLIQYIWFLPAAFSLVEEAYGYIFLDYRLTLRYALLAIFIVGSYLFVGLWLKADTYVAPSRKIATPRQIAHSASPESDTVDRLKELKELLDTGVLTKEEFDAKKKQILGV